MSIPTVQQISSIGHDQTHDPPTNTNDGVIRAVHMTKDSSPTPISQFKPIRDDGETKKSLSMRDLWDMAERNPLETESDTDLSNKNSSASLTNTDSSEKIQHSVAINRSTKNSYADSEDTLCRIYYNYSHNAQLFEKVKLLIFTLKKRGDFDFHDEIINRFTNLIREACAGIMKTPGSVDPIFNVALTANAQNRVSTKELKGYMSELSGMSFVSNRIYRNKGKNKRRYRYRQEIVLRVDIDDRIALIDVHTNINTRYSVTGTARSAHKKGSKGVPESEANARSILEEQIKANSDPYYDNETRKLVAEATENYMHNVSLYADVSTVVDCIRKIFTKYASNENTDDELKFNLITSLDTKYLSDNLVNTSCTSDPAVFAQNNRCLNSITLNVVTNAKIPTKRFDERFGRVSAEHTNFTAVSNRTFKKTAQDGTKKKRQTFVFSNESADVEPCTLTINVDIHVPEKARNRKVSTRQVSISSDGVKVRNKKQKSHSSRNPFKRVSSKFH